MYSENSEILVSDRVRFLTFSESDYLNGISYSREDSPTTRIDNLISKKENLEARAQMAINIGLLEKGLQVLDKEGSFDRYDYRLKALFLGIALESKNANLAFLKGLYQHGELFQHLDEVNETVANISSGLSKNLSSERGKLLTERQLLLMEFTGSTHDLPKLLGSMNAQIDSDHEVIYRKIIGKHLVGKSFVASNGETIVFEAKDVDFITGLSGFHEDIWREKAFSEQHNSFKEEFDPDKPENLDKAVERARMIFHFEDIFGNAIGFNDLDELCVKDDEKSEKAFQDRFIDLFRRHIQLPIQIAGGEKKDNWSRGKVFRPEWGLNGVAGLIQTFSQLDSGWGVKVNPELIKKVQGAIEQVLKEALTAAYDALENEETKYEFVKLKEVNESATEEELRKLLMERQEILTATLNKFREEKVKE